MNNVVFGKIMENVRNHINMQLVMRGRYDVEAMIAKLNFYSKSIFFENLIAIEMRKLEVKFDKSIYIYIHIYIYVYVCTYVGMCILDISKTCLYEFHHEYMLPLFHEKYKITDTDSLIYHIECDDIYAVMKRYQ